MIKIAIVVSKGGHLFQAIQLRKILRQYPHFWITERGVDAEYYLKNEKKYYAHSPCSRNVINAIKNVFLSLRILFLERPTLLLSTGAGIAPPFFFVGKFVFNTKLIFIEPIDFIKHPSLTGRMVYNCVDIFLIQHKRQKKWYPKGKLWGRLL